jgi:hypothetical protein
MPGRMVEVNGNVMATWPGVEVWQRDQGRFVRKYNWQWSTSPHRHYEVAVVPGQGSYWVAASTTPPAFWGPEVKIIVGDPPGNQVVNPVNPTGKEYRRSATYIWIPLASEPRHTTQTGNVVQCNHPLGYPPVLQATQGGVDATDTLTQAQDDLDLILGSGAAGSAFQDTDGLISFVNLSSDFVSSNPEFQTGQELCDMIANFYSTLRPHMFEALVKGTKKPLQGDPVPTSQWDASVTHWMQYLLQSAGGLTDYAITTETYSDTQYVAEFSTSFLKTIFDAIAVPASVITGVTSFISGVGDSLRVSWDDKSRNYAVGLLGQCHEAVQENAEGTPIYRYFPKNKYYYLSVSSSQQEFTSPCSSARKITFNFQYESYVTAIAAAALDSTTALYARFYKFLGQAQAINYKNATNQLDSILGDTTSGPPAAVDVFDVNLSEYPVLRGRTPSGSAASSTTTGRRLIPA